MAKMCRTQSGLLRMSRHGWDAAASCAGDRKVLHYCVAIYSLQCKSGADTWYFSLAEIAQHGQDVQEGKLASTSLLSQDSYHAQGHMVLLGEGAC